MESSAMRIWLARRSAWLGLLRDVVVNQIISSALMPRSLRWRLLRLYGFEISASLRRESGSGDRG